MAGAAPLGPIPAGKEPGEYDRLRRRILWSLPSGLYVLGSRAGGRRNLMTISWVVQVATEPKLVGVGVEHSARTHRLVEDGGVFALSLLGRADRALVRKFVKPVEDDAVDATSGTGTMNGVAVRLAASGAPVLDVAEAWIDCSVQHTLPLGSHTFFVGEVVDCGISPEGGELELLRMEDTRMSYGG